MSHEKIISKPMTWGEFMQSIECKLTPEEEENARETLAKQAPFYQPSFKSCLMEWE